MFPIMLKAVRDFLRLLAERFVATRCPHVAGSLAFTTLLALVPLVTVALALFSNFPAISHLGGAVRRFLLENLLPDRAGRIIATYAIQFSEKADRLTLIGTALLFATAVMLLFTIDRVFNRIWNVPRPRPLITRFALSWAALTLGPLALGIGVFATGYMVDTSVALAGADSWLGEISSRALPLGLLTILLSILYFAVPNYPVRPLHAIAGGIAAAFVFLLMQRLFTLFVTGFPTYTLIYGTFAALPIFLIWLYLSWVAILLGASLAATIPAFFERQRVVQPFPGHRAWAALNILLALVRAQESGRPQSFLALNEVAMLGSNETEALLDCMREMEWVARTDEGSWVLTRNPADLGLAEIIDRFALSAAAWAAAAGRRSPDVAVRKVEAALRAVDVPLASLVTRRDAAVSQVG